MALAPEKFYQARVVERKEFAHDLWTVRVDPGGEFRFAAGQYATLGVDTPAKLVERAYSIVSSPYEPLLEFFVELVPQGELTPLLYKLKPGETLSCRKIPKGRFTLDTKSGRANHLCISTVTGIAPFVSYARTLFRDWKEKKFAGEHRIFLLNGASRSWEFGYSEEIERYAAEAPWLTYLPTVSRPWEDAAWTGETGRVDDLIRKYADAWELSPENTSIYLCGHPTMIENGKGILQRRGWQKNQMKEEVYFIPSHQPAAE
jgi:ferredoxin/flavodoxin---NADP+ reductase